MHHESSIDIREHYTDTAGAIDHVFGLCHLLGFRFAPRIRDLADRRLYVVGARSAYKALDPMVGGSIDFHVIAENWDEILRLAASIKTGTVAPSAILRRLAAYPRQNALAKALKEIGRLDRTLFTLDWISDPALRRRANAGLNKGEARNALARAVFFHRLGEIRDRTFENQRYRASGLNLAVAAINPLEHRLSRPRCRRAMLARRNPSRRASFPRRAARLGAYRFQRRLRVARRIHRYRLPSPTKPARRVPRCRLA